eukprot:gene29645-8347_t
MLRAPIHADPHLPPTLTPTCRPLDKGTGIECDEPEHDGTAPPPRYLHCIHYCISNHSIPNYRTDCRAHSCIHHHSPED